MNETKYQYILWLIVVLVLALSYQTVYFNKFFPIQEGWFYVYAQEILNGKLIYKDFYTFLQPLYIYILTVVAYVSDFSFLALRNYGLFEQAVLLILLYTLYSRGINYFYAALLTLFTFMFYNTNTNDVIYSYYQLTLIFGLASSLLFHNYLISDKKTYLYFSGLLASLSFLVKQSTGLFFVVAFLLLLNILKYADKQKILRVSCIYIFGVGTPIVILYTILYFYDILGSYFEQVFGGYSSKGSLAGILFGFIGRMYSLNDLFITIILLVIFSLLVYLRQKFSIIHPLEERLENYIRQKRHYFNFLAAILISVAVSLPVYYYPFFNDIYVALDMFHNKMHMVFIVFYGVFIGIFYYLWLIVRGRLRKSDYIVVILLTASAVVMYGHGLSSTLEVHSVIPGIGLIFLLFLRMKTSYMYIKNFVLFLFIVLMISMSALQKNIWMYSWWGWHEGSYTLSIHESQNKHLKGFLLSEENRDIIDGITSDIVTNSNVNDTIFTFPHIPLFYVLSERQGITFSKIHYFDVCPDKIASEDAQLLKKNPPKVFVEMIFPENAWKIHEKLFRKGLKSGQRDIQEVLSDWKLSGNYEKVGSYNTLEYGYNIEVWRQDITVKKKKE